MTNKQKYIRAAEILAKGTFCSYYNYPMFCCNVLKFVQLDDKMFHKTYKPKNKSKDSAYFGLENNNENQLARSLALLFMAEMEK